MKKPAQSRYARISTEIGKQLKESCGNELQALASIVQQRLNCTPLESWWAIRDAASMQAAALLDVQDAETGLRILELEQKLKESAVKEGRKP